MFIAYKAKAFCQITGNCSFVGNLTNGKSKIYKIGVNCLFVAAITATSFIIISNAAVLTLSVSVVTAIALGVLAIKSNLPPPSPLIVKQAIFHPPQEADSLAKLPGGLQKPELPCLNSQYEDLSKLLVESNWQKIKEQTQADRSDENFCYITDPLDSKKYFVFYCHPETNSIQRWHVFANQDPFESLEKPSLEVDYKCFESLSGGFRHWYKIIDYSLYFEVNEGVDLTHPAFKDYVYQQRKIIQQKWSSLHIKASFEKGVEKGRGCQKINNMIYLLAPLQTKVSIKLAVEYVRWDYKHLFEKCFEEKSFISSSYAEEALKMAVSHCKWECALLLLQKGMLSNLTKNYFDFLLDELQTRFYKSGLTGDLYFIKKILETLLDLGGNPNFIPPRITNFFYEKKYALELLYETKQPYYKRAALMAILLYKKASIPNYLLDLFKRDLKDGELSLAQALLDNGHIDQSEYEAYTAPKEALSNEWTSQSLQRHLIQTTQIIEDTLKRSNLAWDRVDFIQVAEWKSLKKEVKIFLAAFSSETEERIILDQSFRAFAKSYDALVEKHPLLDFLRVVSKEIRDVRAKKVQEVSGRLGKMISLWAIPHTKK